MSTPDYDNATWWQAWRRTWAASTDPIEVVASPPLRLPGIPSETELRRIEQQVQIKELEIRKFSLKEMG